MISLGLQTWRSPVSLGSPGCDIPQVITNLQIMLVLDQPTNSLVVVVVSLNEALHSFKYRWCDNA